MHALRKAVIGSVIRRDRLSTVVYGLSGEERRKHEALLLGLHDVFLQTFAGIFEE